MCSFCLVRTTIRSSWAQTWSFNKTHFRKYHFLSANCESIVVHVADFILNVRKIDEDSVYIIMYRQSIYTHIFPGSYSVTTRYKIYTFSFGNMVSDQDAWGHKVLVMFHWFQSSPGDFPIRTPAGCTPSVQISLPRQRGADRWFLWCHGGRPKISQATPIGPGF